MYWTTRNGRRYAYRSRWIDGRPVKEYVGFGAQAEAAEQAQIEERIERGVRRQRWERQWAEIEAARAPLDQHCEQADLLARITLVLAGYYLHHGHEWRRRRT
jgi:hypothetical protein